MNNEQFIVLRGDDVVAMADILDDVEACYHDLVQKYKDKGKLPSMRPSIFKKIRGER